MLYLIAFRLLGDEQTHTGFYEALDRMGVHVRAFDGVYLLETGWTAHAVRKQLLPHIKPNDRLIVTKMYANDCAGQLPKDIKTFIERHITELSQPPTVVQIVPPPEDDILP